MNPNVDFYFAKSQKWQEELEELRRIVLNSGLTEELKWGCPCYTLQNKNIVLIHVFKEYCALLFFKGLLLDDSEGILVQQTENVQSARQIRFTCVHEIQELEEILKAYINKAIEVEKAGLKVELKKHKELIFPEEFKNALNEVDGLRQAFNSLTPGRQRAYNLYFSQPKQAKTRETRISKYVNHILMGKGLKD